MIGAASGGASDWDWVLEGSMAAAGSLLFVREASPERVIEAHGMSPASARILPAARAAEALRYPVRDRRGWLAHPWIRVGTSGDWTFVINPTWTGFGGFTDDIQSRLSAGTEYAWVSWTEDRAGSFYYAVNGKYLTSFDLAEPWKRFGRRPDHFVTWMRMVGLPVDKPKRHSLTRDPKIVLLEMLGAALGIRVSREQARGPLLTVQSDVVLSDGTWIVDDEAAETSEWDWFAEDFDPYVFALFACGVAPERVIAAFGSPPADARLLTADDASEDPGWPNVRAGRAGEWAFALDSGCAGPDESSRIARELSIGTEVVTYEINPALNYFHYYADGAEVTSFEPLLSHVRNGTEPDRFLPLMREVGLRLDDDDSEDFRDPTIALLEMLTRAFGLRLSREEAVGPLLTIRPPLSGPGMEPKAPQEPPAIELPDEYGLSFGGPGDTRDPGAPENGQQDERP
jgi:hypothetical protein